MDQAYSLTLLLGLVAGAGGLLAGLVSVRRPAVRRIALAAGLTGLIVGFTSALVHLGWGHGPGTEQPMDLGTFFGFHRAYWVVLGLCGGAVLLGRRRLERVLPPLWFQLAILMAAVLHLTWPGGRWLRFPLTLIGLVPAALGLILNIEADRQFKRHRTTVKPFEVASVLVTGFPFTRSRNPMYLGLTLFLLGIALLLGTLTPLIPVAGLPVLLDRLFIRPEERMLAERFGAEWDSYQRRVRRWF